MLWASLLQEFGCTVTYLPANAAAPIPLAVLWKDGQSDEDVSPGRYSHIDVCNADLPQPPALRDTVQKDGRRYQIVRINALITGFSVIVLQEMGPL